MKKSNYMMTVTDVAEELQISKSHAYKLLRQLNSELAGKGYVVIAGKIPRAFWETKLYGAGNTENV